MHILYLIHYFPPELNGGATRAYQLASHWAKLGHRVTVSTGFPNHPAGRIFPGYKLKAVHTEELNGFTLRRSFVYPTPNQGVRKRLLNHLSLTTSSIFANLRWKNRPDVIIASSPPLFMGLSGVALSRILNVPYIFEIRDLWPQQAIDLGMLKDPKIISLAEKLEMFLYNRARAIIGVAHDTKKILERRGVHGEKVHIIPNGVDVSDFRPAEKQNWVRERYGLNDKFVASYIGTMGLSQGLSVVIDVAASLRDTQPAAHFLMVGEGAEKDSLMRAAREKGLDNITFLDNQPRESIPDFYAASDVCLVPLKDKPLFRSTIPSKIFEIMACAVPIILGVKGEAESMIINAQSGVCVTPEDADALGGAIRNLAAQEARRLELGRNGRAYVCEHYSRETLAKSYLAILESIR